jgi:uracil-DNA glycosylase
MLPKRLHAWGMEIDTPELFEAPATPPTLPWPDHVARTGDAPRDCPHCPRLVKFRTDLRARHIGWWNAPVPGFGDPDAWLAVVGLAPGMRGANRTGRPFTGDQAGVLLYSTLAKFGLSNGDYAAHSADGVTLNGVFITNAVRCVPPANKPETAEIHACRPYLVEHLRGLPKLKVVIALGGTAHQSAVKALGGKLPKTPFGHGAVHHLHTGYTIIDSYHCSQLNTNTGRLTTPMFEAVFAAALAQR